MKQTIIKCDFCGKQIEVSCADIDFVCIPTTLNERVKSSDICFECAEKISNFLNELKYENRY